MNTEKTILTLKEGLRNPDLLIRSMPVLLLYHQVLTSMRRSKEPLATLLPSGTICFEYLRGHLEKEGGREIVLLDDTSHQGSWHRLWLSWRDKRYALDHRLCVGAASRDQSVIQRRGKAASKLFGVPFDAWDCPHPTHVFRDGWATSSSTYFRVPWKETWVEHYENEVAT